MALAVDLPGNRLLFVAAESPFRDGDKPAIERFEERARTRRLQAGETERLLAACGDHLWGVVQCALETGDGAVRRAAHTREDRFR